jgi:hypothetical protein
LQINLDTFTNFVALCFGTYWSYSNAFVKVLPTMGMSAREEAFMELIIRLIDLDIKPAASASAPAATPTLQQVRPHTIII